MSLIGSPQEDELYRLFVNHEFSDFTINYEGKDYPVHKCILNLRCEYFAQLFAGNSWSKGWAGISSNALKLTLPFTATPEVFEEFLLFLYTGKITEECFRANAMTLYDLGNYFSHDALKVASIRFISDSLTVDNYEKVFYWIHEKDDPALDRLAIRFLLDQKQHLRAQKEFCVYAIHTRWIPMLLFEEDLVISSEKGIDRLVMKSVVTVSGAGVPEGNGDYTFNRFHNHAGCFSKVAIYQGSEVRFEIYRCEMTDGANEWFLSLVPLAEKRKKDSKTVTAEEEEIDFYSCEGEESQYLPPRKKFRCERNSHSREPGPMITITQKSNEESLPGPIIEY